MTMCTFRAARLSLRLPRIRPKRVPDNERLDLSLAGKVLQHALSDHDLIIGLNALLKVLCGSFPLQILRIRAWRGRSTIVAVAQGPFSLSHTGASLWMVSP
jgi:hypothetical protein